jgi:hypothetical protein
MFHQYNSLDLDMGNLSSLSNAKTSSISAENFAGEKGRGEMPIEGSGIKSALDLGPGWKLTSTLYTVYPGLNRAPPGHGLSRNRYGSF